MFVFLMTKCMLNEVWSTVCNRKYVLCGGTYVLQFNTEYDKEEDIQKLSFQSIRNNIPSKLLTSTVTHNFDRGSQKFVKNCRNIKAQERHPLSKAFKFEKCSEMPKKIKNSCYSLFSSLFLMLVFACRS